ncbi:hypothetical protein ABVZ15_004724, partial [Escherichia coli]
IFDKLTCVDLGAVVDNKRLGAVLRLAQQKQEELEAEGKRMRSTKMHPQVRSGACTGRAQGDQPGAGQSAGFYPQPEAMSPSLTCGSDMADR